MTEDTQREIMGIINEIVEKSADGNYIYRGEPECHTESPFCGKVSSSLWRQFQYQLMYALFDRANLNYDDIQKSYLRDARRYGKNRHLDDFDLASQLQHVGGSTNLIDFTTCYLVALFFACDGSHDKPGRVIMLKQTERITNKYKIKKPQCPKNRVKAQKSVFAQHKSGIIDEDDIEEIICIRPSFKQPILTYLREKECIYTQKIYNDLQGYIKHQKIHRDAYNAANSGYRARVYMIGGFKTINGINVADAAIEGYSKAIELDPYFAEAHFDRAHVYLWKKDFDKAIEDLNRAIELNPDHALTYIQRGRTYSNEGCYARAIEDFNKAIELDPNNADDAYNNRGEAYGKQGELDKAIEDYTKAIELNPNNAAAYNNRSEAHRLQGNNDLAEADRRRAKALMDQS